MSVAVSETDLLFKFGNDFFNQYFGEQRVYRE